MLSLGLALSLLFLDATFLDVRPSHLINEDIHHIMDGLGGEQ